MRKQRKASRSSGSYEVGYKRPPAQHQWKPGQSGNPKGRPIGGKKTFATLVAEALDREVRIRTEETTRTVEIREAIMFKQLEKALKGDLKALDYLLGMVEGEKKAQHAFLKPELKITKDMDQHTAIATYLKIVRGEGS